MKRTSHIIALTLLSACSANPVDETTQTTTTQNSSTTGASSTTEPNQATTTSISTTTTVPSSGYDSALTERTWAVVLVTHDDVLNVRSAAGASSPLVTAFSPTQTGIVATGNWEHIGSSTWMEVEAGNDSGWVNKFYLTQEWTTAEVIDSWDMLSVIQDLGEAMASGRDLGDPISHRGLHVAFFQDLPLLWSQAELESLMTDSTLIEFAYPGCGGPGECGAETFADAIASRFVSVQQDIGLDTIVRTDTVVLGGNGYPSLEAMIPTVFENLHFVGLNDPGDDPSLTGLDWFIWLVFFELEDGEPKVVGLVPDMWSP